jgi:CRP-like cAMP-binding protein
MLVLMPEQSSSTVRGTLSPMLSVSQLATLAEVGEERNANVGDVLYRVGDRRYPFIAIREGEVVIHDAAGDEIARHGSSGFLGELNLLSGQTVFVTAVVTEPLRYIAVERESLRSLLFEDAALSDLVLAAFIARREALQAVRGIGLEVVGPRSSKATVQLLDFARSNRLPFSWRDPEHDPAAAALVAELDEASLPLVRLPGGAELRSPSAGQVSRALGIGLELAPREEVDLVVVGAGPAGLGAAVYGASEGLETLVVDSTGLGGQAGTSRRIENYLGFPAGITGSELTSRAVTQARKFNARFATPGGNSAGKAAVWLARGGALVTLLHAGRICARRCRTISCASWSATAWRSARRRASQRLAVQLSRVLRAGGDEQPEQAKARLDDGVGQLRQTAAPLLQALNRDQRAAVGSDEAD